MFLWGWLAITQEGELAMSTKDLSDQEIVEWQKRYRSYTFWLGLVPNC